MPGINLNLPIPSLSDTQTQVVTKTAQALTLINSDLADKVTTAEININANLPFNGLAGVNIGYLQFADALPPLAPGTLAYINGEWFMIDSTGSIKITSNGAINLAVVGAIGGDYSTAGALVSYDSANTRYRFFGSGAAALVDLDARNLALNVSTGKVIFGADSSVTGTVVFNVKSVPSSGTGLLGYDASIGAVVDGSTITTSPTFTGQPVFTNNTTFNGLIKHPAYTTEIPMFVGEETQTNVQTGAGQLTHIVSTNPSVWSSSPLGICGLRTNDIVQSVTVRMNKVTTALATVAIKKRAVGGSTTTVATTGGTSTATGVVDITATVTSPTAIVTRERWWVEISFTNAAITASTVSWTQ